MAMVNTFLFGGTWEATDIVRVTIGSKTVDFVAGSTVIATVIDAIVTAWTALSVTTYPEFSEITPTRSTSTLVLTAATAGVPFAVTITPLETDLSPADAQTIEGAGIATTGTVATASAGPLHWDSPANWSLLAIPVNSEDTYIERWSGDILYGLAQSGVTLTSLNVAATMTGKVGLPDVNALGYYEYRQKDLLIKATTANLFYGEGSASSRFNWDASSVQTLINLFNTGTALEQGVPPFQFKGTHASNVLNMQKGYMGVALRPGEVATIATIRIGSKENPASDVDLRLGSGVTLTTITQTGGLVDIHSNIVTLNVYGGKATINDAATLTTLNGEVGSLIDVSSGTFTTVNAGAGFVVDASRDTRAKTYTTTTMGVKSQLLNPNKRITFTNPIALGHGVGLEDITLALGKNINIQVS